MVSTSGAPGERAVHVEGNSSENVIVTGDYDTVTVATHKITLPAAGSVDIARELQAVRQTLEALDLEPRVRQRISNALNEAEDEGNAANPDRDVVGAALERVLDTAKKADKFAEVVSTLKPHVTNAAAWLGKNWYKLLAAVGLGA
ncbi:MAG: hypothetical protein IH987_06800 [Planctomycetes bacterium]|nr:hypothetical protein [Planctomycetota bacterium]